ncbi:trehalose 6-phosphate synthase /trehalose 6-phosphatase [Pedobacter psychrotolerans]|uniref:Bifunctional alpha,alpha-trehalose-phosphate synthase (UDP-forming)/trehalose-phosphatase n=1 Tax=Pedobacter psychrotolerans TaxID=1843235 RepID=A0A4R2HMQ3_9SPHI|nr:bifunctional alpha,alpha-trehalose-phosphate synthase (UDP-forming)/trehalose-phosphatase [Pedobacter psychrotolerans]TCO31253.1 trehalose 6-phosphate synthase /trehalose 6-phosphatase [Pedobacter psychrotolerans]GGE41068.1 bifunctional alpha,alpha-trehalose-phosphate synthase (UDP-forming)/trehalose-phosphatase [Pedobacter psychrotolerans]
MKTVIISNRLPVKIIEENNEYTFIPSEGGLATGLGDVYKTGNSIWIGWPGIEVPEERQQEVIDKLSALNLYPVFLTQEEINLYYEGFSNEVLWPVFHYLVTYAHYEQSYWDCYKAVNHKFAKAALKVLSDQDKIWIQDYQLLLLSGILRDQLPKSTIGFFQHIPFPSYEIFRLIPWREELLNGMLGADLIGFHTYDDVRHFLSTATRLLPVNSSANVLNSNERQIVVEAFPMGIDFDKFSNLTAYDEVKKEIEYFRKGKEDMKVILSIDRLDYSKGILERLKALELLLQAHPEYIGKIELYMIVVPSRDTVPQYRDLKEQIDQFVGNLNARYRSINWIPVNYFYRSFPIEVLSALYATADICLVTPMRDGMNLVSKEYVASRNNNNGVLILSEMAGASKELTDAVIVNPNNIGDIMDAIVLALKMPQEEQESRMKAMRNIVEKFNVKHWVNNFILRLDEVKDSQNSLLTKHAVTSIKEVIAEKYDQTTDRVLFLDYDGTLVDFAGNIDDASPDEELYNLITKLTADSANKVVIISGRRNETLEKWFGHLKVDLIAEHGAWQKAYGDKWNCLPLLTDQWKQEMKSILETYTDRTPGSFIEEKSYSLVWHYRKAEEGLGDLRANEIVSHLKILAADKGLQLMPGNKVIEFKNMEVNKGKAALNWLYGKNPDFILALGDDHTDEDIFKALPNDAFTIKVGNNISEAKYYLNDFKEVRKLLWGLVKDEVT